MLIQMLTEGLPMLKIVIGALSSIGLFCLVLIGASGLVTAFGRIDPPYQLSEETRAAMAARFEEMNTIDPLTGKTKMQTLTEESAEEHRRSLGNLLAARERVAAARENALAELEKQEKKLKSLRQETIEHPWHNQALAGEALAKIERSLKDLQATREKLTRPIP
jgi:hypothetical protein